MIAQDFSSVKVKLHSGQGDLLINNLYSFMWNLSHPLADTGKNVRF